MDWILLVAFQFSTFSIVVSSQEECQLLGALNLQHWQTTGQIAQAVCMKSFEV